MSTAIQKGENKISLNNKKIIEDELTKTYDWFKNTVFPAVEGDEWPIIADQDYAIRFGSIRDAAGNWNAISNRIYIKKGTQFSGINDEQDIFFMSNPPFKKTLIKSYNELEEEVVNCKLNVPMESFPD